jgi:hypothetical protein
MLIVACIVGFSLEVAYKDMNVSWCGRCFKKILLDRQVLMLNVTLIAVQYAESDILRRQHVKKMVQCARCTVESVTNNVALCNNYWYMPWNETALLTGTLPLS